MKLECYATGRIACELVPAPQDRAWMDASPSRYPYRCLPLNIANAFGWHLLMPCTVDVDYTGGPDKEDIQVSSPDPVAELEHLVVSHFNRGILTFHPGYLFRTDPGWQLLATGPFNWPKDGIQPLTGLVETDWLPFPFTMNWQMTRPGRVRFEKGEPFCQIVPVPAGGLDRLVPQIRSIDDEPDLKAEYEAYRDHRTDFLKRLAEGEAEAVGEAWQKYYFRGRLPTGTKAPASHASKLRLPDPVDTRADAGAKAAAPPPPAAAAPPAAPVRGVLDTLSVRPVPISRSRHDGLGVARMDYAFAAGAHLIGLGTVELEQAANHYPTVFTADPPGIAAVLSGEPGRNLFVAEGRWAGGTYVPAAVRQYPFSIRRDGTADRWMLCIDEACPWLDRAAPSKLLDGGQLTELGRGGAAIADALLRDAALVAPFVAALQAHDLLVPAAANQSHPLAGRAGLAGLLVVDHVRYGALAAEIAEDWRRRGWSALVSHHVRSQGQWRRLAAREAPPAGRATTKETA
ncbi:SapC protein [Stella humosa]|uniref:SapC protein n=1 Tax=Stella humosa TaxID=94 RepID=A0A3N1MA37_9PROT|nr:DUF6065 family protein [Stella humosa]ROQ00099.1 SapC protein [Stella humosa]BBK30666.1 hypothetical protein STHU_13000 [Stella humosa]